MQYGIFMLALAPTLSTLEMHMIFLSGDVRPIMCFVIEASITIHLFRGRGKRSGHWTNKYVYHGEMGDRGIENNAENRILHTTGSIYQSMMSSSASSFVDKPVV